MRIFLFGVFSLASLVLVKPALSIFGPSPAVEAMRETCSSFCAVRGFAISKVDAHPTGTVLPPCICRAPFAPRGIQYDPHERTPKLTITPTWSAR